VSSTPSVSVTATPSPAGLTGVGVYDVVNGARAKAADNVPRGRLTMSGVCKSFRGSPTAVLDNVALEMHPGEFVVVVGPSGC
jgi:ABC-type bacteriocin/lantibiotic exporter with double-glycine peptidase domain